MKNYALLVFLTLGITLNSTAMTGSNFIEKEIAINTDEYVKIKSSELTPPVIEEILKQYPTSKLGGAYKNDRGEFKLIMVLKSGTRRTVYIDQYGNWINKK
ncbi:MULTISPECIES: hypothetical protein [Maribacter]|uniref:Beta-lactamase-inhibitor-like, PepSY-like n=1 Tax=Maribacter dokdonensis TaxID=320912 RepID=A0A1H4K9L5_9FLAO|nr:MULTISPECIES: hypothetical protein [Maribacter]HAI37614.1 hypothetical protein [Maribacter sp.]APA63990.1 hypothetical protein YQ22_06485 [Maribacter sp. 1_2014MBL_MicDiv]MBU2900924.1 hypothetical protein [Maribacter dokdonensis]MDP2526126.1 hypothetical protein [Maribacter dokdonensis]PHN95275.1 hypothetical protein CSC80_08075 [Maribacter sp. 6B07]|tara:strand:+ start:595 stop:897 length:303 start_codon:yes stop_codon:yes gene_type:complete